ncbi:hypothetical protein ACH5RR_021364 [Cinchona calisaya]|uniref:Uncharacterized protein n=1 Tax=Cinchona calisaya TaxID=153742 RepID=A0ABD2ZKL1_9GENT
MLNMAYFLDYRDAGEPIAIDVFPLKAVLPGAMILLEETTQDTFLVLIKNDALVVFLDDVLLEVECREYGFKVKKNLVEKLLAKERILIEPHRMPNLEFVHYNLQPQNLNLGIASAIPSDVVDPMDARLFTKQNVCSRRLPN